ncbi:SDR family NAD(P)-dependent oxidoreductase [Tenacibaculum maritimum]|uniref:SDR family NAD(P)-dependent oxidoreductase n=1 Tax=Tenacibaculum maritimum TaxID=107401 RepID=UPI0012E4C0CB|nr:SDR family oxidoreductase [Tenacibaculum maritimum]CAA0223308.1 putative short-chain dehydrogenase/reductase [Tenacibaculum maritimum]CAA0233054.1 putative short-chain dehydrogenase/reductase [Tenacibaculum maritimum]CAA0250348.1 putative short-chain dehydrogenase/reductase [Tenacibaculum maritimum]CAA0254645.1 putative short-chain dehydrogenase/reductase [Tenacibaculum maritimum]
MMKTILVVGGSKGIGKAIVEVLKKEHKIVVFSRTAMNEEKNSTHFCLNVLEDELPEIPTLHGLVYCPGSINLKPFTRLSLNDFKEDFNVNVLGAIRVIKKYEQSLKANSGNIVLFSSVATKLGMPFHTSVAASKSAVEGLGKSLAAEYATKITVNIIAPTVTDTPLAARLLRNDKQKEIMKERHPLKTYLKAREVAILASYLLSDESKAISGQIFPIDAGMVSLKI